MDTIAAPAASCEATMLSRLLAQLPSVRLERELAVCRAELTAAAARVDRLQADYDALQRKHDRLVDSRLFRTGDISQSLLDTPARSPLAPAFAGLAAAVSFHDLSPEHDPHPSLAGAAMST